MSISLLFRLQSFPLEAIIFESSETTMRLKKFLKIFNIIAYIKFKLKIKLLIK